MNVLTESETETQLKQLHGWRVQDQCLVKEFQFADFPAALVFMNRLVPTAEKLNHHPDWSNSYNKVHISLTTHDASGLTQKDFDFARAADEAAAELH